MKRISYLFLTGLIAISCSSIKTSMDYDNTVDFASYKTYQFDDNVQQMPLNDLNRRRVIAAVESELQKKGFTNASSPDVIVNIVVNSHQESTTYANTNYYGGGGYRRGWGGGMSSTTISTSTYQVGTVFIDIIDAKSNYMVWQGLPSGSAKTFKGHPPCPVVS